MIYTIFFRKLQKKFGVAIQTMGYSKNQKVYTPHLGIGKIQTVNDTHYHCQNENENENENEKDIDSTSVGANHFQLLCKCGKGFGVRQSWYSVHWDEIVYFKEQIILGINNQKSLSPLCPIPPPSWCCIFTTCYYLPWWWYIGTIYQVWGMWDSSGALCYRGIVVGDNFFLNFLWEYKKEEISETRKKLLSYKRHEGDSIRGRKMRAKGAMGMGWRD